MTTANYQNCYKLTRVYEGGNDDDPRDPGGRTSRGIIQREYDAYRKEQGKPTGDVWKASEEEIADIYHTKYWNAVVGDQWPDGADLAVWDFGVNSGPARAKTYAAAILGSSPTFGGLAASCKALTDKTVFIKAYCKRRLSFLQGLKTFVTFGGGWSKRVASVEANGVRMALAAANVPHDEIKKKLETEAGQAKTSANKSATGAATGGTVTGAGGTSQDWHALPWTDIVIAAGIIAGCVILTIYFVHWWNAHNERAKAYAAVAGATGG